ncbi:DUF4168 domain-containing protein [Aliidiomarina indica]|uniref:DUF4168 domain-containing protein n=1 Tax=Aliidiomarina indica TaxID=2749147 RepID=UPI00188E2180|nr:DUF4168 domain-containing protein [Aliidiomarina indica]
MLKRTFALSAIAAAMFSMPALAQQQGDPQAYAQQQMEQMANEPVTEAQLEKFVVAIGHIERINDEFVTALESVETQEEAQELQINAQREMVESVEETGLTVEEYNALAYRLQNDPEIQQAVEEMRESDGY